ncbi:MAG: Gfo/Idh/MocA family oxidoreductase, partial [Desulfobulbaceae bacterium]|nr:Gfo/Idh/MocA family oxidoreductase [Desulfobulbaceae bacterium]
AIVSVPDEHHFPIARDLIEHGLHTLVVKPLAASVKQVRNLIALTEKHAVYGAVEYHKRFDESNLKLLTLIRQGNLGRLLNFSINYSQRKLIPTTAFRSWVETTDIFQYLGVHYVDLIHFLTQAQPRRVMAIGAKKHLTSQGIDTWDTIQTLIEWRDDTGEDFTSSHLTGWVDPDNTSAMSDQRLEVIGTKGCYRSDQKHRGVEFVTDEAGIEVINPYFTQFYPNPDDTGMSASGYGPQSIIQFVNDCKAIVDGRRTSSSLAGLRATFASSIPVAQVIEANKKSLTNGNRWIDIEPIT